MNNLALVAVVPRDRLRESLLRLDTAARARLVVAGDDIENAVAVVANRLEARAVASVRNGLQKHAWVAIGLAIGLGVIFGRRSRR